MTQVLAVLRLLPKPFSVPFQRRTMFVRCFTITKIPTSQLRVRTPTSTAPGKGREGATKPTVARTPKRAQAPILPTETYFEVATSKIQNAKQVSAMTGCKAKKTPSAVSTPLPPRKPAKQVKLWPRMASRPATRGNQGCTRVPSGAVSTSRAIKGAKKPLERSTSTTGSAGFHPRTRNTLVSPAFLLPCSRISIFFHAFAIHTAVGIDPRR